MRSRVKPKVIPLAVLLGLMCLPTAPAQTVQQSPVKAPSPVSQTTQITIDDALRLANAQASSFQTAVLNEGIAREDVKQAQAAFLPKVSAPLSYIYNTPAIGLPPGEPRAPSFIASDAISAYEGLVNVSGDFDIVGKLRATVTRNKALLAAAHAGTEVAKRALAQAVIEGYYGLALASAQRQGAEGNLASAEDFEHITSLLLSGGEVASVDLTRAQLQTLSRRDELERARAIEEAAAGSLRVLVGFEFTRPVTTTDLTLAIPTAGEGQQFKASEISNRPEFIQFDQQLRAAEQDIRIAKAERLPSLSYSINGGFDSDSLRGPRLKEHTGVSAAISLTIPIFDWGTSRSKEAQARLRAELAQNERAVALRGFTEQFYAARAQTSSAATRIDIARQGVSKAQSNLASSIARYRAGEAQIVEVTEAQKTLIEQRTALYQAIFDYQVALARLRQSTGR